MRPFILPPNIIDIEASGFAAQGYPIEIGIALASGDTYCTLIRPEPEWTYWDDQAEAVHRVPRDILDLYGKSVHDVARQINDLLSGQVAYSDGWRSIKAGFHNSSGLPVQRRVSNLAPWNLFSPILKWNAGI